MRVLLVEDDKMIANGLSYSLIQEGYDLDIAFTIENGKSFLSNQTYALVLLDIGMPDGEGYELCTIAKQNPKTAVIFITAYEDEGSIVKGLDLGADDYVVKPFRLRELQSRIKSVLRRTQLIDASADILQYGEIIVLPKQAKVLKSGEELFLSPIEYRLLLTLMTHVNQVLSRDQLLDNLWDVAKEYINENTLTVYIKRLRAKVEMDPQRPTFIQTIRGFGYKVSDT